MTAPSHIPPLPARGDQGDGTCVLWLDTHLLRSADRHEGGIGRYTYSSCAVGDSPAFDHVEFVTSTSTVK